MPHFPKGYEDWLKAAKEKLNQISPAELTVEVEHDGEDINIVCSSVMV